MIKLVILLAVATVGFMVWCLVEAISADGSRTRNLSKAVWIPVILLLPLVGALAWVFAGRPQAVAATAAGRPPQDLTRRSDPTNPAEEAADFSDRARRRVEEQRRRYEQQKKNKDQETPEVE
ncbi:PLD nuclease N-terminal domain-containing protein [Nocardioides currus]|uniref:Cardiolipin synthase N-terminal domain-containing protein n=1 Tax=Nocardioides currus TaxID=2133958 RepID=A0A2R7YY74_9ACTN|nr:PLD nuclease N-terminal domain-containing protein [Nocardioides currus]PUA81347.1 hypothetical protein C7S10_10040 [Nocardioides currus]